MLRDLKVATNKERVVRGRDSNTALSICTGLDKWGPKGHPESRHRTEQKEMET